MEPNSSVNQIQAPILSNLPALIQQCQQGIRYIEKWWWAVMEGMQREGMFVVAASVLERWIGFSPNYVKQSPIFISQTFKKSSIVVPLKHLTLKVCMENLIWTFILLDLKISHTYLYYNINVSQCLESLHQTWETQLQVSAWLWSSFWLFRSSIWKGWKMGCWIQWC